MPPPSPPPPLPTESADAFFDSDHIRFLSKVVDKGPGWIRLERPLPYDLRTKWNVRMNT